MRQFLKIFLAAILALAVFTVLVVIVAAGWLGSIASSEKPEVGGRGVLYIDLQQGLREQTVDNPLADLGVDDHYDNPGLYDMIRIIRYAKTDSSIKGIYLRCNENGNGLATSDELRDALLDFRKSKKFVYAYGDVISQRAYYIANVADRIYCNPRGGVDWRGFAIQYLFFRQALEKLEIEPQIFYAGKFKSATEPFRADQMTEPNKLQSTVFLNDIYNRFLMQVAAQRGTDTATLHRCANELLIRTAADAVHYKLVDGAAYDDVVKDEIRKITGTPADNKLNFVLVGKYAKAVNYKTGSGSDRIAVIYAQGDIVDGKGEKNEIGGDTFRWLIRKARTDKDVKAIVVRVNSGGGSAMASEIMWRELAVARKDKPVILSFGDYAASGGYYMSCGADSIFAQPNTLTGSIGVFSIVPNMKKFFSNKLGVTFDGVRTGDYADMNTVSRPLNEVEKHYMQSSIDSIYQTFLTRVSDGRRLPVAAVDSIAQGRVWTGSRAIGLGLVDRLGGLQDAIDCAARMSGTAKYRIREYPEPMGFWERIFGSYKNTARTKAVKEELGEQGFQIYTSLKRLQQLTKTSQARLPFEMSYGF
ncbi:MAG: signal peptide peptidase SppA [Bacteroidetes bacterium]|nr:signal peptide peptidase SppA [Bacteroidota bacterium]